MQLVTGSHARYKEMIMTRKNRRTKQWKERAAVDIIPSLDNIWQGNLAKIDHWEYEAIYKWPILDLVQATLKSIHGRKKSNNRGR